MKARFAFLLLLLLALPLASAAPTIEPILPSADGATVRTTTPTLEVRFGSPADPVSIRFLLDGRDLREEDPENFQASESGAKYAVPAILPLDAGNHTLEVFASDEAGESTLTLRFTVDSTPFVEPPAPFPFGLVVGLVGGTVGVVAVGATATFVWLERTGRFSLRKFVRREPERLAKLALYVPLGLAVGGGILGLLAVTGNPASPRFAAEYVLLGTFVVGLGPWGLQARRRARRTCAYERAFGQFLFELSDALRGGIDPMKAIVELAKTEDGILKQPLRRAADAIRMGRPLEDVLEQMTRPMGSTVVSRYGALLGEASVMGGSIGNVIQRSARDMDEIVKIHEERQRQLRTPVLTMYMAFVVLLVMVLQLVQFAPNIGSLELGVLGGKDAAPQVPRMPADLMQARFFHLLLANAVVCGLLVGSFVEGRLKFGIVHAIVMVAIAAVAYPLSVAPPDAAAAASEVAATISAVVAAGATG